MPADSSNPLTRPAHESLPCGCLIEVQWRLHNYEKPVTDNPGAGQETLDKGCTAPYHDAFRFIKGVGK